jgi:hypothetical protein
MAQSDGQPDPARPVTSARDRGVAMERLRATGAQLDVAVNAVAATLVALDQSRTDNDGLANRYQDFADRMADEYPMLAGPARKIVGLLRDLDVALANMNERSERFIALGGRAADVASALGRDSL